MPVNVCACSRAAASPGSRTKNCFHTEARSTKPALGPPTQNSRLSGCCRYRSGTIDAVRSRRPSTNGLVHRSWKLLRLALHLLAGLYVALVRYPRFNVARQRSAMRSWSRQLLRILQLRVRTHGLRRLPAQCLIVSNHISWLDIFIISARFPAVFVAKSEIRDWPLIGLLCARAGTIFIQRGRRASARHAGRQLASALHEGRAVSIFPEGTTTDGLQVAVFHRALFQPAIETGASVQPVLLRYVDHSGAYSAAPNYIGDTSLMESIWQLVSTSGLVAEMHLLQPIETGECSREELAASARTAIQDALLQACGSVPGIPCRPPAERP